MRYNNSVEVTENLEISVFTSLGLLVLLNSIFIGYGVFDNRREVKRLKAIEAAKVDYDKAVLAN